MNLHTLLVNPHQHRLRSGWRVVFFIALLLLPRLLLSLLALMAGDGSEVAAPSSGGESEAGLLAEARRVTIRPNLPGIFSTLLLGIWILFVSWVCLLRLDRERFTSLGIGLFSGWGRELGRGLATGALMIAGVVLMQVASGGTRLHLHPAWQTGVGELRPLLIEALLAIGLLAAMALYEELLYRGYAFQTLLRDVQPAVPMLLLSLFFAFGHWENPGRSLFSTINTLLAGLWLSLAYLKSGNLWYPFGLHFAWNWMLGPVCGLPVSGLRVPAHPLFEATSGEPTWLTGGAYGSEGGVAASLVLLAAIGWLLWRWKRPSRNSDPHRLEVDPPGVGSVEFGQ
ncbi:MAG: CPBP family intramembrane glutamic endopeptidase [Blastocatellia bacterium]|jgi:membrane protease YdiL (CAAX protease family)